MALWQWFTLGALSVAGCLAAYWLLTSVDGLLDELDEYIERPYK